MIHKSSPEATAMKDWVDKLYDDGRVTFISKEELVEAMKTLTPHLFALKNKK